MVDQAFSLNASFFLLLVLCKIQTTWLIKLSASMPASFIFLLYSARLKQHELVNPPPHHQSLNHNGRWGTTDDFATSFFHFSLFSTALWDLPNSRPVHSLMLSSHLFLCLPCPLTISQSHADNRQADRQRAGGHFVRVR